MSKLKSNNQLVNEIASTTISINSADYGDFEILSQLINPIKLEAVENLYICVAEQNILRTLSFRTQ